MDKAAPLPLAPESAVSLIVDDKLLAVIMCSPFDLDELAAGHLFGRGLISTRTDLLSLSVCPDMRAVRVRTASGIGAAAQGEGLLVSGCGAARVELFPRAEHQPRTPPTAGAAPPLCTSLKELTALAKRMFGAAELYARTGGMHIAALASGSSFIAREDVGRHNAVDKVLGRALLDGLEPSGSILLTSGRIAADMAAKAINAGIPLLASRSIPTTEAFSLALEARLTLVGRIGSSLPLVYTAPERILADSPDAPV